MYPWLWFWAPQIHLPWSGNVAQDIDLSVSLFGWIKPSAGNRKVESRAATEVAY
jgi:hypothetical protein